MFSRVGVISSSLVAAAKWCFTVESVVNKLSSTITILNAGTDLPGVHPVEASPHKE